MNRTEKAAEVIATAGLILAGALGVAIGVIDFFGWETQLFPDSKSTQSIILIIVGVLAVSIGLERIVRYRVLDRRIDTLDKIISRSSGGQYLRGEDEIFSSTLRLIGSTEYHIRSLVFSSGPKAPKNWANRVVSRLRDGRRSGSPLKYDVVLALDFDQLPSNFRDINDKRLELYTKSGGKESLSFSLLNMKPPLGLDILILDRSHVQIGFTTAFGVERLQSAMLFEDQPEFALRMADWFDQFILRSAISYERWIQDNP